MKELTLAIFKPDTFSEQGVKNRVRETFFSELKKNDLEIIVNGKIFKFTPELLEQHYGHTKKYGQEVFEDIKGYLMPKENNEIDYCQAMIIYGDSAILKVRKIIGPTKYAAEGIRATSESAVKGNAKNYIHASGIAKEGDPYREAKEEIARFFPKQHLELMQDATYSEFFNSYN